MIPNFIFKQRAWAAIKPWLQLLVVIGLLAVLPGTLYDSAELVLADDMTSALEGPVYDLAEFSSREVPEDLSQEEAETLLAEFDTLMDNLTTALENFFLRGKGWILLALGGASLLLTPMLMMPLYGALLDAYRKKELTAGGCLRRLRLAPRALLLTLWIALRVWVWMLPGMALMLLSVLVPALYTTLVGAGTVLSLVLGIRAGLHYILAPVVLADLPDTSINGCVRRSWQVMRTRKMQYFSLQVSFAIWHLLLYFVAGLAVNPVMTAISLTVMMMGNLLLTIYINGSVVVFWDTYGVKKEPPKEMEVTPDEAGEDLN